MSEVATRAARLVRVHSDLLFRPARASHPVHPPHNGANNRISPRRSIGGSDSESASRMREVIARAQSVQKGLPKRASFDARYDSRPDNARSSSSRKQRSVSVSDSTPRPILEAGGLA